MASLFAAVSDLAAAPAVAVSASSYEDDGSTVNPPENAYDGDLTTRWSAMGIGEWIQFSFSEAVALDGISIAFHQGDARVVYFSVEVSDDGSSWAEVYNGESSGSSIDAESFSFASTSMTMIRIIGNGNNVNTWNSYTEVAFPFAEELN